VGRRTVFNIAGNKYRLIARVNYISQTVFVVRALTHSDYHKRGLEIMTTTTLELDKKTYGQLLGHALPHVIRTEEESERLTKELMRLDELTDSSAEEKELAELLTLLIDEYETRRGHPAAYATTFDGGA
jgi:hypothetical protein